MRVNVPVIHREIEVSVPVSIDEVEIDLDELAPSIIEECDTWEIEDLVFKLDELAADWNFTQKMFDYFKREIDRRNGFNPAASELVRP